MNHTYKKFIILLIFSSQLVLFSQPMKVFDLVARQSGTATMWDGQTIDLWGFKEGLGGNVLLPSPILVVNEGDSVTLNVTNQSSMPHTIHMHGLDVNQANDGVGATSFDIPPISGTGTYKFKATHAGTYIYHCHVETVVHLQLGMYGAFVVKAAGGANNAWTGGPAFDKDYTWVISDVDKSWHDNIPMNGSVPAFEPDYFLINGKAKQQLNDTTVSIAAIQNDKVYVRLINIGYTINKVTFPSALQAEVISSDGRPLPSSVVTNEVEIYPGERYGVMLDFSILPTDSISVAYYDMYSSTPLFTNKVPLNATPPPPDPSITFGQLDDFEDETEMSWGSGGPNPTPPTAITSGGPTGLDDAYLQITSSGTSGAGGKMAGFNTAHWTGDYIAEGVKSIPMDVNNLSGPDLYLRVKLDGPGGNFYSINPIMLPAGSGWQSIVFPIEAADLTGGADVNATLSDVTALWIYSNPNTGFPGLPTNSVVGVDNILADGPATSFPVTWSSFNAYPENGKVALEWTVARESDNTGFAIEMAEDDILHQFNKIGFVPSLGYTNEPRTYTFLTDSLKSGTYLFRLMQIDLDGSFTHSKVVSVSMNEGLFATIFPNPIKELEANIELRIDETSPVTIEIIGIQGQVHETFKFGPLIRGTHTLELDLSDLSDSFYLCRIKTKQSELTTRIMILRD